jgi:hypothetical protein
MPLGNALIGDRFVRYIAVFAASAYRDFGSFNAANIIVRIRVMIILFDRSIISF